VSNTKAVDGPSLVWNVSGPKEGTEAKVGKFDATVTTSADEKKRMETVLESLLSSGHATRATARKFEFSSYRIAPKELAEFKRYVDSAAKNPRELYAIDEKDSRGDRAERKLGEIVAEQLPGISGAAGAAAAVVEKVSRTPEQESSIIQFGRNASVSAKSVPQGKIADAMAETIAALDPSQGFLRKHVPSDSTEVSTLTAMLGPGAQIFELDFKNTRGADFHGRALIGLNPTTGEVKVLTAMREGLHER
jgi:hypothetical protein